MSWTSGIYLNLAYFSVFENQLEQCIAFTCRRRNKYTSIHAENYQQNSIPIPDQRYQRCKNGREYHHIVK